MAWKVFSHRKFLHIKKIHVIEELRACLDKGFVIGAVQTGLSKDFDYIPHAKREAYSLGEKALFYLFSYLKNQSQCVRINNKKSSSQKIISDVLQCSITGTTLFNFSINDLLFFVSSASMDNFGDGNSLYVIARTVAELKNTLPCESEVVID